MTSRTEYVLILRQHLDPPRSGKAARLAEHLGHETTAQISRWKGGGLPRPELGPVLADYFGDERLRVVPGARETRGDQLDRIEAGVNELLRLLRRQDADDRPLSQRAGDELARVERRERPARRRREAS